MNTLAIVGVHCKNDNVYYLYIIIMTVKSVTQGLRERISTTGVLHYHLPIATVNIFYIDIKLYYISTNQFYGAA